MTIQEGQDRLPAAVPEPLAPLPAPPAGPVAPPQLPFGLTVDDLKAAPSVLVRAFAPVLAVLTVLVAIASASTLPDGFSGSLADWLRTAVAVVALAMGGSLAADASFAVEIASAEAGIALRLVPLAVTAAILVLAARAGAREERRAPSTGTAHLLARTGLAAVVAGIAAAIVAGIAGTSDLYGLDLTEEFDLSGSVDVGAGVFGTFVGTTLLIAVAVLLGRAPAAPAGTVPAIVAAVRSPERNAELRSVLRTLRTFVLGLLAVAGLAVMVGYLYAAVFTDQLDDARVGTFVGLLVLGLNAAVVVALGALGVPGVLDSESRGSADLMEFFEDSVGVNTSHSIGLTDHGWALLVLLVPVVVALGAAVRRSLREPGTVVTATSLKTAAFAGVVAGLAAALLVQVSLSAEASTAGDLDFFELAGEGAVSVGPSLLWAPLLGAFWAAAAVGALRVGPTLALSLPPRVTRLLAGRRIAPVWAAALTGTVPPPAGRRSVAVRRGALVSALLVAVAAIGAAVVALLNALVFSPQAAAEDYLDAVADADLAAVLVQLAEAPDLDGQPLLSEDVLSGDGFVAIDDVVLGETHESDSSATVEVSYTVAGERVRDSISLTTGEDRFGLFRTWKVAETLPVIEVWSQGGLGHRVGDVTLDDGAYRALPGGYTFSAADHPLLTAEPASLVVTSDSFATASLVGDVTDEAMDAARDAVDAALAECAAATSLPLADCPFFTSRYWGDDLTGIGLTITEQPEYYLEYSEHLGGLEILTESYGEIRLTGTQTVSSFFSDEVEQRPYDETFSFTVSGEVTVSGDELDVRFWN
jgi:hypothetical protein